VGVNLLDQAGRWTDVRGHRLPGLERNIIRYRVLQMTLFMHEAESLKSDLEGISSGFDPSIFLSDGKLDPLDGYTKKEWRSIPGWKRATEKLKELGHLTGDHRDEVVELIDYRNSIAHEVHNLLADIGTSRANREAMREHKFRPIKYEYYKLRRIQLLRSTVFDKLANKFIMRPDLDRVSFDSSAGFIEWELIRLKRKIDKQITERLKNMHAVREEINQHMKTWDWHLGFYPTHPKYYKQNGSLSASGISALNNLIEQGVSDLACALMMNLSIRSIRLRKRKSLNK
jgi:hypothetical protein